MTIRKLLALLLAACFLAPLASAPTAYAQDERSALIAEINGLRASYGLAPYSIDPSLMAMAQEHSEYQASIHQSTHLHSDGRTPPELGVVENVAGGTYGYVTAWDVVYNIWVDPGHLYTMTGYASGMMGVGVANDGETTYFTLELIPTGVRLASPPVPGSTYIPVTQPPPPKATPLFTATPLSDGSIVHVVGYGQTLWSIATVYGVSVDQLRAWNNIAADDSTIYAGQRLLVRPAGQVTPALALTPPTGTATHPPAHLLPTAPGLQKHRSAPLRRCARTPAPRAHRHCGAARQRDRCPGWNHCGSPCRRADPRSLRGISGPVPADTGCAQPAGRFGLAGASAAQSPGIDYYKLSSQERLGQAAHPSLQAEQVAVQRALQTNPWLSTVRPSGTSGRSALSANTRRLAIAPLSRSKS